MVHALASWTSLPQSVALPWTQLTHVNLLSISLEKCLIILKETPNLELNISPALSDELDTRSSWSPRSIRFGYMEHESSNLLLPCLPSIENAEILACPGYTFTFVPLVALLAIDDAFLPNLRESKIHQDS
ncbi:hypothetical protein B0H12DRAFT_155901 [Mycena haematopus]|nr:hypothetical protein B0H12DRAFT_155901 [Mycena haematopus]